MNPYLDDDGVTIYQGDALSVLQALESESVQMCVTSPPYYGLRDYGTATWTGGEPECDHKPDARPWAERPNPSGSNIGKGGNYNDAQDTGTAAFRDQCKKCGAARVDSQIGLEQTPFDYIDNLVTVFREVYRVLKNDGTLWLNLGDTYSSHKDCKSISQTLAVGTNNEQAHVIDKGLSRSRDSRMLKANGFKNKEIMGIPWRVAFALSDAGWYLRQDIIWNKPNPMPESVTDRCTKSHEYIFLLTKSPKYYYNASAIKEPLKDTSVARLIDGMAEGNFALSHLNHSDKSPYAKQHSKGRDRSNGNRNGKGASTLDHKNVKAKGQTPHTMHLSRLTGTSDAEYFTESAKKKFDTSQAGGGSGVAGHNGYFKEDGTPICGTMANKKSVWTVTTQPYSESHFATFPEKLIIPCILAGSREGDVVLDPFGGAGTSAIVARNLNRNAVLIELNPEYCKIIEKRLLGPRAIIVNDPDTNRPIDLQAKLF